MIGPAESYRRDPADFATNLWANIASTAIVVGIVVVLIVIVRPRGIASSAVDAVIEAS
jgi:ABC-type branched-subunit amino acid transport system permease subunit